MSASRGRAEEFLAGFRTHHGSLAEPALEYLGSLGPVELRQVNLVELSDALHYLEVARVVADLSDPDEGFTAFARLTEEFHLPDATELLDRVVHDGASDTVTDTVTDTVSDTVTDAERGPGELDTGQ